MSTKPIDSEETKQLIRQLAYHWMQVELLPGHLFYSDYIKAIAGLHALTGNADRTTYLVLAVLNQAKELGRSAEWVEAELKIEAQAEVVGNRTGWLLADLKRQGAVDAALDAYNERMNRLNHKS